MKKGTTMFFGANAQLFKRANRLRQEMTEAELLLWELLKDRTLFSLKFRRQHPLGIYIADFYCHALKLVIEVDGKYHLQRQQKNKDLERTAHMLKWGVKTIRFTNEEVLHETEKVIQHIMNLEKAYLDKSSK